MSHEPNFRGSCLTCWCASRIGSTPTFWTSTWPTCSSHSQRFSGDASSLRMIPRKLMMLSRPPEHDGRLKRRCAKVSCGTSFSQEPVAQEAEEPLGVWCQWRPRWVWSLRYDMPMCVTCDGSRRHAARSLELVSGVALAVVDVVKPGGISQTRMLISCS